MGARFRLTVVGCSGSYPGPDSAASCYLLQAEHEGRTWSVVVDLGNGSLGALQRYVDPLTLDAVLLSHLHADHCLDMASLNVLRKWHPGGQPPQLAVWGPEGTAERLHRAFDLPTLPGQRQEFVVTEYGEPFTLGPFTVEPVPVDHPVPAFGLRVTVAGRTVGYTGDTGPTDSLERLAAGVDLLLSEASFRTGDDNPPGLHLTGQQAGEVAARGRVGRLVITHVPPWHDPTVMLKEAVAVFDGPTELAAPGAVYEV